MKQHKNKAGIYYRKRFAALILALALCLSLCGCAAGEANLETFLRAANEIAEAVQNNGEASGQTEQTGQPDAPAQEQTEEPVAVDLSAYTRPLDESHVQTGVIELDGEAVESMYVDNELVLFAEDGTPREDIEKLVAPYGAEVVGCLPETNFYQIELPETMTGLELSEIASTWNESPAVEDCFCNFVSEMHADAAFYPNDLQKEYDDTEGKDIADARKRGEDVGDYPYAEWYGNTMWGHAACNLPQAWEIVKLVNQNPSVRMGLIDKTFYASHEDLKIKKAYYLEDEDNPYAINQAFSSSAEHGTHVAGIMGAVGNNGKGISGVTLNASLMGAALPDRNISYYEYVAAVLCLLKDGVKVINISQGDSFITDKRAKKTTKYY